MATRDHHDGRCAPGHNCPSQFQRLIVAERASFDRDLGSSHFRTIPRTVDLHVVCFGPWTRRVNGSAKAQTRGGGALTVRSLRASPKSTRTRRPFAKPLRSTEGNANRYLGKHGKSRVDAHCGGRARRARLPGNRAHP